MSYDVQFSTSSDNKALLDLVRRNVGRESDSSVCTLDLLTDVWRCEDKISAEQLEARVKGALLFTLSVQPSSDIASSGSIPGTPTKLNPKP